MGISDHITCLLRNLYAGQEATVSIGHRKMNRFKIGKGVHQSCILSPCLFNFYVEDIMCNAGLDESEAGIKTARGNINNFRYVDDTTLMAERKEPLDESERGKWKSWLKTQHSKNKDHGIRSHHFMVNRWRKVETVTDFIFFSSKITADSDCSDEFKSCLLLGRKGTINLDSILKSRDIPLWAKSV